MTGSKSVNHVKSLSEKGCSSSMTAYRKGQNQLFSLFKLRTPSKSRYHSRFATCIRRFNNATMGSSDGADIPDIHGRIEQDLSIRERSSRGGKWGRERGRGRGGGSRGGRGSARDRGGLDREVMVSKALSKLLRHAAEDVGLALDAEGFARVDQVVSLVPSLD